MECGRGGGYPNQQTIARRQALDRWLYITLEGNTDKRQFLTLLNRDQGLSCSPGSNLNSHKQGEEIKKGKLDYKQGHGICYDCNTLRNKGLDSNRFHLLWILCSVFFTSASPGVENCFRNQTTINWSCRKMYNHGLMHLFMPTVPKEIATKFYQLSSTCPLSYSGLNYYNNILQVPSSYQYRCLLNAYCRVPQTPRCTLQMNVASNSHNNIERQVLLSPFEKWGICDSERSSHFTNNINSYGEWELEFEPWSDYDPI